MTDDSRTHLHLHAESSVPHDVAGREDQASTGPRRPSWHRLGEYSLIFVWIAAIVIFGSLRPDSFLSIVNLQAILSSQTVLLVATLAALPVVLTNEFDLSIGATLGLSAVIVAVLNVNHGVSLPVACLVALLAGPVVGAANGALVVLLGVDGLIATLGVGTLVTGLGYAFSNYVIIGGIDGGLVDVVTRPVLGIQLGAFIALGVAVVIWYFYRYATVGRHATFVGLGREVAVLSGLPVARIRFGAFVLAGLLAAFAGILMAGTLGSADPNAGANFLLPPYAAVFLGTTVIRPGRVNPWGAVVAVYFLATGITGLQMLGLQTWIQQVFYGLALVFAIALARVVSRQR